MLYFRGARYNIVLAKLYRSLLHFSDMSIIVENTNKNNVQNCDKLVHNSKKCGVSAYL